MSSELPIVVVIPCLNEEFHLGRTCESLGFGIGAASSPKNAYLIIVDNGSSDDTLAVATAVQRNSRPNSVLIGHESERGYVPPRHTGNKIAEELSYQNGWDSSLVTILQADADSIYSRNYISEMRKVSAQNDPTTLVEAYFQYPPEFKDTYSGFVDLCVRTDNLFAKLFADEQYDVIVADATSGYRLSTYFEYGGHQREFTQVGDEIHAETSRLFMRFKGRGAIRIRAEDAYATHSVRKIIKDPLLEMATAGFPREEAWYKRWREQLSSPSSLNELMMNTSHPNVAQAMNLRVRHAIGIFAILPAHFFRALGKTLSTSGSEKLFVEDLAKLLPRRTVDDAKNAPATLLTDVFSLIDNMGEEINKKASEAIGCNGVFPLSI